MIDEKTINTNTNFTDSTIVTVNLVDLSQTEHHHLNERNYSTVQMNQTEILADQQKKNNNSNHQQLIQGTLNQS